MHVVATAGHVDHGKSTLIKALTGTDPDRLAEEKARGLTIDLGFASATLPSQRGIAFVDVPGHVRFLKNMLAGVGGVSACLFVVAATEGWKPQSEEHLRILQLLGIRHGMIALTKVGMADDDLRELARMEIVDSVTGTFLEGAEIVEVDAIDGVGIGDITDALDRMLQATPTAVDAKRPRLWIDRVFAAKGAGTVVTGTLTGGMLRVDQELTILPEGINVRIRGLQSLHAQRTKVGPGNRVACNLTGVSHDQIRRGDVLVFADQWHTTRMVDADLEVLDSLDHKVTKRGAHLAYIGSGEYSVKASIIGASGLGPGDRGAVRLHLPADLPLLPGDRFILREAGRGETLGGGQLLDVDPLLPASKARPDMSVARVVAERGRVDVKQLLLLTGESVEPDIGHWVVDPTVLEQTRARLAEDVDTAGPLGLDIGVLDEFQRAVLEEIDSVTIAGSRAKRADSVDALADHPFLAELEAGGLNPPDSSNVDRSELRELIRRGEVIEEAGFHFAPTALTEAARIAADLLAAKPDGVTVAELRDAWGTTRKFAIPLATRLDGTGVTRRRGDLRIAGPRLPRVSER